jgi:scyllo-inositol 2-dehydrogenase (NADP+)
VKKFAKAADIKVGVIGYGGAFNMGRAHLQEMAKAGMTPAAVAELDPERLKVAAQEFPGIETYTSVDDMLKKSQVNLLAIITPHDTHAPLALQSLRARRHVVCEKPFAITTTECDEMIDAAAKSGVVLSTYHNRHWDGCILQAVKTIRSGAIGEVYRLDAHMGAWGQPRDWWRSSKSISGGVLYDWGVHLLEYTFQIMNAEITEVSGFAKSGFWSDKVKWAKDTNEDEAFLTVRYANGAWSTLGISTLYSRPRAGWIDILGTQGSYNFDYRTWELTQPKGSETVITKGSSPASESEKLYQNIADHLTGGTPLVITPQWARRPVHVIDLACQSAAAGRTMPAKYR